MSAILDVFSSVWSCHRQNQIDILEKYMLIYNTFQLHWLIKINYSQMGGKLRWYVYFMLGLFYHNFVVKLWFGILLTKHN